MPPISKDFSKIANNSGNDAYYHAYDGQFCHWDKPEYSRATTDETDVPSENGEISPFPTIPKKQIPFFVQPHNRSLTPSTIFLTTSAILYFACHFNFSHAFKELARPSVKSVGRYN